MKRKLKSLGVVKLASVLCLSGTFAKAQMQPTDFILGTLPPPATSTNYHIDGYGPNSGSGYYTSRNYHLQFGKSDAANDGFNRIIKTFKVGGETFSLTNAVPGALPFMKVNVNRYGSDPEIKITSLYEVATQPSNSDGSNIYLVPDYVGSMEELINSYVINRGTDNVFVRTTSASTTNNITRIDLILEEPIAIPATEEGRKKSGFLLMERGGNDFFKIAGITGLSLTDTTATSFGTLLQIKDTDWGSTGQEILSVVMQKTEADTDLKPSQFINDQPLSGVFISLDDLGIDVGTEIYGISLMGNNVTNPEDFSETTSDGDGGLDFMAGGGFFTRALVIEGNLWTDANGNAIIESTGEPGISNGLWANLVDNTGNVISSVPVNADGTYSLFIAETNVDAGKTYSVILTNDEHYEDDILTEADLPENNYVYTGTNFEHTPNPANNTGMINIGSLTTNVEGVNFGIERAPESGDVSQNIDYPAGGAIPEGWITTDVSGTDQEQGVLDGSQAPIIIDELPAHATMYYNGLPVEVGDTIARFDPALLSFEDIAAGSTFVVFNYSFIDDALVKSFEPGSFTISWDTPLPVSLLYFNAYVERDQVILDWATASESNNKGFEIEKSKNGNSWNPVGFVNSLSESGNSDHKLSYVFVDNNLYPGLNFFRLKQLDQDGRYKYSPVRTVVFNTQSDISLTPNPTNGIIVISGLPKAGGQIVVVNAIGQCILNTGLNNQEEYKVDISGYSSGVYYISIHHEGGSVRHHKIVKR